MTGTDIAHWTAWAAFALWAGAENALLLRQTVRARLFWTLGAAALGLHMAAAFQWYHHWSHSAAVVATAEQTATVTGWRWGGGVWINYAMLALWSWDAIRWWNTDGNCKASTPPIALRGAFAFLWFQGAVVFAHSGIRAIAGLVFVGLAIRIGLSRRPRTVEARGGAP
jgi:hypothetical protein